MIRFVHKNSEYIVRFEEQAWVRNTAKHGVIHTNSTTATLLVGTPGSKENPTDSSKKEVISATVVRGIFDPNVRRLGRFYSLKKLSEAIKNDKSIDHSILSKIWESYKEKYADCKKVPMLIRDASKSAERNRLQTFNKNQKLSDFTVKFPI